MLLYVKSDTQITNIKGDLPSLIDSNLPEKVKAETGAIWTAYQQGYDNFLKQYSNYLIVEKDLATLTASTNDKTSTVTPHSQLLVATNISVEQICSVVDSDNPPPIQDFKIILGKFNKNNINGYSATHKCTTLFAACRKGSYDIVKELLTIPNINLRGAQETYTTHGNTCIHVANWRGHVRIVALLISKGAILEPKTSGNKVAPNNAQERNYTLEEPVRSTLATIYRNSSPPNETLLNEIISTVDISKTISAVDPLPLWAVIGLPKDEIPPQFMKSDYIWYCKHSNENKMSLMPLTVASHLTATYLKNRKSTAAVNTSIPVPPAVGFISNTIIWGSEDWTIDFNQMTASRNLKSGVSLI